MDAKENYLPGPITETPMEGRELAIKLALKSIAAIQPDVEIRKSLRGNYATYTSQLISSAEVIAMNFKLKLRQIIIRGRQNKK